MEKISLHAYMVTALQAVLFIAVVCVMPVVGLANTDSRTSNFVVVQCDTVESCEQGFTVECLVAARATDHPGLTCFTGNLVRPGDIISVAELLYYIDAAEQLQEVVRVPGIYLVSTEGYARHNRDSTDYTFAATLISEDSNEPDILSDFHADVARQSFYKVTIPVVFEEIRVFLYPFSLLVVGIAAFFLLLLFRRRQYMSATAMLVFMLILIAMWFYSREVDICRLGLEGCA